MGSLFEISVTSVVSVSPPIPWRSWRPGGGFLKFQLKHICKMSDNSIFNRRHVDFVAQQIFHGSDLLAVAGDDQVKETEIGIHIQRKAMSGYPARDVHADGRNLSARRVHARQACESKGADLKICQRANQYFFKFAHIAMHVFAIAD